MLAVSFFSIVREYVGILLYICLPIIILSAMLAIWLHYRQKRRRKANDDRANTDFSFLIPDPDSQSVAISPLAQEDRVGLIKECRKQLSKSRARYVALRHDFTSAQKDISETENLSSENNRHMENLSEKIAAYEKQITDLQNKLEVLETVVPVQDEAYFLRQAIRERDNEIERLKAEITRHGSNDSAQAAVEASPVVNGNGQEINPELQRRLERLQEENTEFSKRVQEQDYLKDVYVESKLQVEFLQNQLEQRIRNHTQSERRIREIASELNEAQEKVKELQGQIALINQQNERKQREMEQFQQSADLKDTELHRVMETLQAKTSQIVHLENLLAEVREHNNLLNASFADSQDMVNALKEQLAGEQEHIHYMEDKLARNKQLLERIFRDLESSIGNMDAENERTTLIKQMY